MRFEDRIRAVRQIRELSQSELAQRVGVAPTTIAGWETGRREIKARDIQGLCNALDVDPASLWANDPWNEFGEKLERIEREREALFEEAASFLLKGDDVAVSEMKHATNRNRSESSALMPSITARIRSPHTAQLALTAS